MRRRFVMLDRDGTIIRLRAEACGGELREGRYLADPHQVELIPGVAAGLRQMTAMGLGLVVVTNQSGIGRGIFDRVRLDLIHLRMSRFLEREEVHLDGIYFCPHTPEDGCACRKPNTGLVAKAAEELGFDPREGFMIGDNACDIQLGRRVGATTLLVRTGYGERMAANPEIKPDYVVANLWEAAGVIRRIPTQQAQPRPLGSEVVSLLEAKKP